MRLNHPVFQGQLGLSDSTLLKPTTDFRDFRIRKFRPSVAFTRQSLGGMLSPVMRVTKGATSSAPHHVLIVVVMGAWQKVVGPHASGGVAVVPENQAVRYWPIDRLPHNAMCAPIFPYGLVKHLAVPLSGFAASPKPTGRSFRDISGKLFLLAGARRARQFGRMAAATATERGSQYPHPEASGPHVECVSAGNANTGNLRHAVKYNTVCDRGIDG